jgi:hypothetical protein
MDIARYCFPLKQADAYQGSFAFSAIQDDIIDRHLER